MGRYKKYMDELKRDVLAMMAEGTWSSVQSDTLRRRRPAVLLFRPIHPAAVGSRQLAQR